MVAVRKKRCIAQLLSSLARCATFWMRTAASILLFRLTVAIKTSPCTIPMLNASWQCCCCCAAAQPAGAIRNFCYNSVPGPPAASLCSTSRHQHSSVSASRMLLTTPATGRRPALRAQCTLRASRQCCCCCCLLCCCCTPRPQQEVLAGVPRLPLLQQPVQHL
jgi:hypothetical protein